MHSEIFALLQLDGPHARSEGLGAKIYQENHFITWSVF
jgi:hypothetical protein